MPPIDMPHVSVLDPDCVEQPGRIVGHLVNGVRAVRFGAAADAAVVVDDGSVLLGERRGLQEPASQGAASPMISSSGSPLPCSS